MGWRKADLRYNPLEKLKIFNFRVRTISFSKLITKCLWFVEGTTHGAITFGSAFDFLKRARLTESRMNAHLIIHDEKETPLLSQIFFLVRPYVYVASHNYNACSKLHAASSYRIFVHALLASKLRSQFTTSLLKPFDAETKLGMNFRSRIRA